jgi:predicted transcriptional regulator YheO
MSPLNNHKNYLLTNLERLAEAIVCTMGESLCEMVIHDFQEPERSIVWIKGQVSNRTVGGSMSQIGLAMMAEGDHTKDKINYITRTRDGKVLKSATVALRDENDHVFGAICINLDITNLVALEQRLRDFVSNENVEVLTNIHFDNNIAAVGQVMIDEAMQELGMISPPADIEQRVELVQILHQHGFFGIRNSVPLLADYLGVSRTSIYNYLSRGDGNGDGSGT